MSTTGSDSNGVVFQLSDGCSYPESAVATIIQPAPSEYNVVVGSVVRLLADEEEFKAAFESSDFAWADDMSVLLGTEAEVVARENEDGEVPGHFGLPECNPE